MSLLKHFYNGKDYELLKEKTFHNWELLDEDGLSLEEYYKNVENSLPKELSHYALSVLKNWEYFMHYSDGIIDLIRELKQKGYKLYILLNMHNIYCLKCTFSTKYAVNNMEE